MRCTTSWFGWKWPLGRPNRPEWPFRANLNNREMKMIVEIIGDWRSVAIRGVAAVAFGVLALVWPHVTLWGLVVLFGAFTLIDGASILATVFRARRGPITNRGLLIFDG